MAVKYVCDGCGKEAPGNIAAVSDVFKPDGWFERGDKDGQQHACCRECINLIAKKSGKTSLVAPF